MAKAKSFIMLLSRRYRVYVNNQTGYWFMDYRDGSGRERVSLKVRSKPEAEAAVRQFDSPPKADVRKPDRIEWTDFQKRYLKYKEQQGKAPGTVNRYRASVEAFGRFLKAQGVTYMDEITLTVIEGYIHHRCTVEKCDPKTAYNDALVIKNAFKWGAMPARHLLKSNPALGWETPEPVKPKRRCYTPDEVARIETSVRPWLRPILTVLAWSGLRIGELVNLRWKDVDLEKRLIHVRVREDWRPKGKSDRAVPMHPKVREVIEKQPVGLYVFRGPKGGTVKETYALECLKADLKKLEIESGDLHGLRRFFATTMMRSGVDVETVRQWGGWKSMETMLRYLADVEATDSVKAMDAAAQRLAAS